MYFVSQQEHLTSYSHMNFEFHKLSECRRAVLPVNSIQEKKDSTYAIEPHMHIYVLEE